MHIYVYVFVWKPVGGRCPCCNAIPHNKRAIWPQYLFPSDSVYQRTVMQKIFTKWLHRMVRWGKKVKNTKIHFQQKANILKFVDVTSLQRLSPSKVYDAQSIWLAFAKDLVKSLQDFVKIEHLLKNAFWLFGHLDLRSVCLHSSLLLTIKSHFVRFCNQNSLLPYSGDSALCFSLGFASKIYFLRKMLLP